MKILYDYKEYPQPKQGIFSLHKKDAKYILPDGWEQSKETLLIIGETKDHYITNLVSYENDLLPLGPHKSRLMKWVPTQLNLFE